MYLINRLEEQKKAFKSFDLSLKSCEKRVHDLDEESLQKFSAVESVGNELKKQLDDIMVSRDIYKKSNCIKRTIMMHAFSYSFGKVIFVT